MVRYSYFIPENIAPLGVTQIGIYNQKGNRVGQIPLGNLASKSVGNKQYSFGAISDVHITYTTGESDLINVLNYFNNDTDAQFICISGDLATVGTDDNLSKFQTLINTHSQGMPIYVSAGNHDAYDDNWNLRADTIVSTFMKQYTGHPLYYSIDKGQDVFIFIGVCSGTFSKAELQWLYETLEANRNKRCFLFQHVFSFEGCGDAFKLYNVDLTNNTMYKVFISLLKHYHNTIWFHGHSHTMFHGQLYGSPANYDNVFGCHSVHIPSCAIPRTDADGDLEFQVESQESEGYLVDVYENGIHLRGRDFVKGEFLPIASYWLNTIIKEIPEKTYEDPNGIININPVVYDPYNLIPQSIADSGLRYIGDNNEDGYKTGYRLNSSGTETAAEGINVTGFIPIKRGDTIYFKNIKTSTVTGGKAEYAYLSLYDNTFACTRSTKFNQIQNSSLSYIYTDIIVDSSNNVTAIKILDQYSDVIPGYSGYFRISAEGLDDYSSIRVNRAFDDNSTPTMYTITNNFTNVISSNTVTSVANGQSYVTKLIPTGAMITSISVLMDGVDITSKVYLNGIVSIASVTGPVVITALSGSENDYTNVIPMSIGYDGTIFNNIGYINNYRLTSNSTVAGNMSYLAEASGYFATGFFPYTIQQAKDCVPFYILGVDLDTPDNNMRIMLFGSEKDSLYCEPCKLNNTNANGVTISKLGDKYYQITPNWNFYGTGGSGAESWQGRDAKFARMSLKGTGEGVIITVNEEITQPDIEEGIINLIWSDGIKLDKNTGAEGSEAGYAASQHITIEDGCTYTMHQVQNSNGSIFGGVNICYYDANGTGLGYELLWDSDSSKHAVTLTPIANAKTFRVRLWYGTSGTIQTFDGCHYISYVKIRPI